MYSKTKQNTNTNSNFIFVGSLVSEISTKTGTAEYSDSGANVIGMICNGSGVCCSTALDDDLPREKGEVDTYGAGKLGECSKFDVGVGEFHLTVTTSDVRCH